MGFYGKIYSVMGDAFKRLRFKNTGAKSTTTPNFNTASDFILEAKNATDSFTLENGNQWIGFVENADSSGCKIFHAAAASAKSTSVKNTIASVNSGVTFDKTINLNDVITVNSLTFDAAGHANGYTSTAYKLNGNTVYTKEETAALIDEKLDDIPEVVDSLELAVGLENETTGLLYRTTALEAVDVSHNTRLENLEGAVGLENETTGLLYRTAALETKTGNHDTQLSDRYTKAETDELLQDAVDAIPNLDEALTMLANVEALEVAVGLENETTGLLYRTSALENTANTHNTRLETLESMLQIQADGTSQLVNTIINHGNRLTTVENILQVQNDGSSLLANTIIAHGNRLTTVENILQIQDDGSSLLANTLNEHGERLSITETFLGITTDEDGVASSTLATDVEELQTLIGDLNNLHLNQTDISVESAFGDLANVSVNRKNLAEILGNLDSAVGANKTFASEIGVLSDTVSLLIKTIEAMDIRLKDAEKRLTVLEEAT